jgi:hypothetical protein
MPTIGTIGKPSGGYHAFGGSGQINQEAELLEMPARGRLLQLGAWIGGWDDAPRVRLCVWAYPSKTLLGQSAQITVANEGGAGPGGANVALYVQDLEAPVEVAKGASFYVGFVRHPDDAHQVSTGASGSGPHYHGRSGAVWPNNLGNAAGPTEEVRRIGAYVADWETLPGAWVYRSGVWTEAETVQIYRGGVWVDADGVQLYRAGGWVDAD